MDYGANARLENDDPLGAYSPRGEGRALRRYFFVSQQIFGSVAFVIVGALRRSDGFTLVVYHEDPKTQFALPTLRARFGRRVSSHRVESVQGNYYVSRLSGITRNGLERGLLPFALAPCIPLCKPKVVGAQARCNG